MELFVFFRAIIVVYRPRGIGMSMQCGPVEGLSDGYTTVTQQVSLSGMKELLIREKSLQERQH